MNFCLPPFRNGAAIEHLLKTVGAMWTPELAALYQSINAHDVACVLHRELQPSMEIEEFETVLRAELLRRFAHDALVPMPGAVQCVEQLSTHLPCAVASGSPFACIELAMDSLGIASCFQIILSSESVARGKPHPDVFLAAAEALGTEATRCVVFEDSLAGVRAAQSAGMKIIAIPSGHGREEIARIADRVFTSQSAGPRIDWILTRGEVETHFAEIVTFEQNGQHPSDHFPVTATLSLP